MLYTVLLFEVRNPLGKNVIEKSEPGHRRKLGRLRRSERRTIGKCVASGERLAFVRRASGVCSVLPACVQR